jgi:hypothetical protein
LVGFAINAVNRVGVIRVLNLPLVYQQARVAVNGDPIQNGHTARPFDFLEADGSDLDRLASAELPGMGEVLR